MTKELARKIKLGKFDKVSYHGSLPMAENNSDYVTFESRESIVEEVVESLKDPNINRIGVHGMGGIGKTTLIKDVSSQVTKSKLFKPVIMATIGQNPDIKHIQGQLADILSLSFGQETEQGRAALLRKRLQMEKNILIVLDDLWSGLDLERIGISRGDDYKILVTSRSEHVLSNKMNIGKNFEVKNLTQEESWSFFQSMIIGGSIEMTSPEWKDIATQVASKCGKLPIALATVAKALRGKRLHAWKDALIQLNNPASVSIDGVNEEVYASLKLSYDYLNSSESKLLFLLCSMFPDDYDIKKDDLCKYAMGLKFLQGMDTLETARDRTLTLVDNLEYSCMLQKSEKGTEYVKMHDVVRDVAIYHASKNDQMCTLSYGKGLDMWRDEDTHGHYTAILVNCVSFCDLPKRLRFPNLEVLVLVFGYRENNDVRFPKQFFEGMEKLKVLHLKNMCFPLPPSSLNYMVNLRTLLLINCELKNNIDMIGELKNLEILDFSGSNIKNLPSGISQLSRLKELSLFNCKSLEVIPPQVISKLTKLETLHISDAYGAWGVRDGWVNNARIAELQHLSLLTTLYLCVPYFRQLPEKAFSNTLKLKEFVIIIGRIDYYWKYRTKKALEISMRSRNVVLEEGVSMLLKKAEELVLTGELGKKDVLRFLDMENDVLRFLDIQNDDDVEYLISEISHKPFPNLEHLSIKSMIRLHTIVQGSIKTVKVFENLKVLCVEYCYKLKYLFPFPIMESLYNLEELIVKDCEMMEAIVVIENEIEKNIDKVEWSRLRRLYVRYLPQLKSFCCERLHTTQPMDDEIVEEDQIIANLMTPFDVQVVFPDLKCLEMISIKNIQEDQLNANFKFRNLETITLISCENIKYIFTHNTMIMLKKLRRLDVVDCHSLEEVFNLNEDDISFSSNLEELILEDLPNLKQVWSVRDQGGEIQINFASLIKVEVKNCPKLKILFPTSLTKHLHQLTSITILDSAVDEIFAKGEAELEYSKVSFPKLQELRIERVNNLERIWPKRLIVDDLPRFRSIVLRGCKNLKSVVTLNVMKVLEELEELHISTCESLEEVFEICQKLPQDQDQEVPIKLKKIILTDLPSLKHVWWSKDFDGIFCRFHYLDEVEITGCKKLQVLFPPSIQTHFPYQLKD